LIVVALGWSLLVLMGAAARHTGYVVQRRGDPKWYWVTDPRRIGSTEINVNICTTRYMSADSAKNGLLKTHPEWGLTKEMIDETTTEKLFNRVK
jgi:hypothetical protein